MKRVTMIGKYNAEIQCIVEIEVPNMATEDTLQPIISALEEPFSIDDHFLSKYECKLIKNDQEVIFPNSAHFKEFDLKIGEPQYAEN